MAIVVLVCAFMLYNMLYNVILEAKDVQSFKVEEFQGLYSLKLKISGHPFYSGIVVRSISTKTDGPAIIVSVHLAVIGLAKPETSGNFNVELMIRDSVNESLFGQSKAPIWKRESSSTPPPLVLVPHQ
jgi:hypothetical protein